MLINTVAVAVLFVAFLPWPKCRSYAKGNEPSSHDWASFKKFHGKTYPTDAADSKSLTNFFKNLATIEAHNKNFDAGWVSYKTELNQFADQDPIQFNKARNGAKPPRKFHHNNLSYSASSSSSSSAPSTSTAPPSPSSSSPATPPGPVPASFNWRNLNKVSPVKDQGQCSDCWAFSATSAVEDQVLIRNRPLVLLSEQELVDCDTYDSGCTGGYQINAFAWLQSHGFQSASSYPYTSGQTERAGSCAYEAYQVVVNVTGYSQLHSSGDRILDADMEAYLVQNGPLSIIVDSNQFQFYSEGVFTCKPPVQGVHAVLLVGYGTDPQYGDYWSVQNSWGAHWGEHGYIRIQRDGLNDGNSSADCGVTRFLAAYPIIQ